MRSRSDWNQIALEAPYYAVLAEPRFLGDPSPNALQEFYESGEVYAARVLTDLGGQVGRIEGRVRSVLEFGCGPGRIAAGFARRGLTVTAADIAPAMLERTRAYAAAYALEIDTVDADDLLRSSRSFDLITCVLLLQHMDSDEALSLIRKLSTHLTMGGFLHLQFPFRTHRSLPGRMVLGARERLPLLNALANRRRGRSADAPLLTPRIHALDTIVSELGALHCSVVHFDAQKENELETVRITVSRGMPEDAANTPATDDSAPRDESFIDVRELMRATSLDEWNRRAEEYFSGLTSFDAQLAKPFSSVNDAPALLVGAGVAIQALQVLPGMTVVDFGAGTGWLSRSLAQLGCRVITVDVSQTALDVARRDFEARPLIGAQPVPRYLRFDGTRIALEDASVDRVICFDSFHHVPNPDVVLREFSRILKPGALAAFSEPGPHHSKTAQSQFEMRTYGVLENDIDLHVLWPVAKDAGFEELRVGVYYGDPQMLPLENFEDLLAGGEAFVEGARWMRMFLENVRLFTLRKAGEEQRDSRSVQALRADVQVELRSEARSNQAIPVRAIVRNTGSGRWLPSPVNPGGVSLGVHLYQGSELLRFDHFWQALPRALEPGEAETVEFELPPLAPGAYLLEFDCVAQNVAWFATNGSLTKRLALELP